MISNALDYAENVRFELTGQFLAHSLADCYNNHSVNSPIGLPLTYLLPLSTGEDPKTIADDVGFEPTRPGGRQFSRLLQYRSANHPICGE